ncbi:MAG TPA: penicillin acylase family protein, partial [Longimicrobiales bacterium]|nr:penicillin acylase family protein [Longimicrobiales bacterium]
MRTALRVLGITLAVAALGVAALALYVRSALPPERGTIVLAGLSEPAEVWRDSLGVPHIWAEGAHDLMVAQGYVHAQDRLWQMELLRRAAEGRLAELFGPALVPSDRFLRTLGLWSAAGAAEATLEPGVRALLEAYAAGINAWIADTHGALPPELLLTRARPEPWTPRHSLAIEKIMAMDLSLYQTSLSATRAAARLGAEALPVLLPGYPSWGGTIVDGPALPAVPGPAAALVASGSIAHASNAWVIGGAHTASGRPILANDMHLALRAPSLWYLAALHAARADGLPGGEGRGLDVAGTTLPGVPFVITGHNRAVAWGFTNAMVDDVELFVERADPRDPSRYLVPGGAEPFRVRTDTIRVKGREAGVEHTIRSTRHGPVISDLEEGLGGDVVALRWLAHDPASSVRALPAMNLAADADALVAAVDAFDNPHVNIVYADTAGAFGYVMAGRVPLRANGAPPPLLPVPGWSGEWDWTGELPFDRHPRTRSPARGYVVSANNRQAAGAVADRVTTFWADPFRALRISALVEAAIARGGVDAAAVHRMQLDVV